MTNYKGRYDGEFEGFDIEFSGDLEYNNNNYGDISNIITLMTVFQGENRALLEEIANLLNDIDIKLSRLLGEMRT